MGQTSAHYSTQCDFKNTFSKTKHRSSTNSHFAVVLLNEVAVHVLVSKTLDCDQPKCQLIVPTLITDEMEF